MRTVLLAAGLLTFTAPALAQFSSDTQVENRLSRIENEISTLSRAIYKGDRTALSQTGQNFRSAQERADAGARMDALEQRIRELNGMLEEQAHNNRMLKRKLDKINQDMSLRLQDLEGKQSTSVIASRAAQPTTPNMQTPTQLTPTKHPKPSESLPLHRQAQYRQFHPATPRKLMMPLFPNLNPGSIIKPNCYLKIS